MLFTPLVTILAWPVTYRLIWWVLTRYWGVIVGLVVTALLDILITKVGAIYIGGNVVRRRYAYMLFDVYRVCVTIVVGLTKGIVRFVLVVVIALLSLPRMDRSPFPAWIEAYLLLDTGSKSFQARSHDIVAMA